MESVAHSHPQLLTGFTALVLCLIALDLFLQRRQKQEMSLKKSVAQTLFWVFIAMAFNAWIWFYLGSSAAMTFLAGYVVEMSLSVDNLFVFLLIFGSFKIPTKHQHRVLFWGILGALVMRAICITVGVAALQRFQWLEYVFAAILILAGIKTLSSNDDVEDDPTTSWLARSIRKIIPIADGARGEAFFVRENGRTLATELFLVLVLIELSDVIFAVDSIPAVLAITTDSFLVYSSNIFAILGLRALYFVLASLMHLFRFLNVGVSIILILIGAKIGLTHWIEIPVSWTLAVILGLLFGSILLSLLLPKKANDAP